ncbi:hypothetical protein [Parabacteroides massiliensis]|uniref:hypothetical protein n=1 Tax=Parabacteroides massiliensis TaxID=1750560 RepID=UPI001FC98157|nr:hypothetical protein [Parabacteroides massiliensis]
MKHLAPKKAEETANDGPHPFHKVEHIGGDASEMQNAASESRLQHLGRTAHKLDEGEKDEQWDEPLIFPSLGGYVGVTDMEHSLDTEVSCDNEEQQVLLHYLRVEPVVMLAIVEEEDELQHPGRPKQAAEVIDADERQRFHETEVVSGGIYDKCYREQRPSHHPVDDAPILTDIDQVFGDPRRQKHISQHEAIEQWEENSEISLRSHPQLDGTHTLETSAEFEETCDIGENAHHGNRIRPDDKEIASRNHQGSVEQKLSISEAELHLEEKGKWHRHAHHIEHDDHEHVFSHQAIFAHYLAHRSTIDAARHQEGKSKKEINPRLQATRHITIE